ncbi:MAG: DUF4404 family protein [Myxococcota bacterium]
MPERTLRKIVAELHERLERSPELDPETQGALRRAADEINETLDEQGANGLAGELRARLSDALTRFEGSHPKLTESVKRLVDQLAEMGI